MVMKVNSQVLNSDKVLNMSSVIVPVGPWKNSSLYHSYGYLVLGKFEAAAASRGVNPTHLLALH